MRKTNARNALKRAKTVLLALVALAAGLGGRPAAAGSYPESTRPVYLGMGGATFAGGSVDAASGAALMPVTLGSILSYAHFPVTAGFLSKGQDKSPGPFGPGTFMLYDWFLQYDGSDFRELVGPGNRRFEFGTQNANGDWIDTRDPEMLGAVLHIPPPAYGAQKVITWKNGWKWYFDGYGSNGLVSVIDAHGTTLIYWIYRDSTTGLAAKILLSNAYPNRYISFHTTWPSTLVDSVTISYDAGGAGSPNRTWTFQYDGSGRLSSMTDPLSGVTRWSWTTYTRDDGQVLPLLATLMTPRGNLASPQYVALTNQYDSLGRVTRQTYADGGYHTVTYPAHIGDDGLTTVTDQSGHTSSWGCVWGLAVNGHKEGYHLANFTDALGRTTAWDQLHAGSSLDTRITDYQGRITTLAWDYAKGNLTGVSWTTPTSQTASWSYTYDPTFSRVTSVTDPLGHVTTYTVSAANGDTTALTDALSHVTSFTRDSLGNVTALTNALNQVSHFTYGSFGELLTATDPLNHQTGFTIDSASRVTAVRDANGKSATVAYNQRDQATSFTQTLNGSPLTTSLAYDANGNRVSLVDPRLLTWQWSFDNRDRLFQALDPQSRAVTYTYNQNSQITNRTDRTGQQSVYSYGTGGLLSTVNYYTTQGLDSTVTYSYSPTTHLLIGCNDSVGGNCTYQYDTLDRLTVTQTPTGTLTATLADKMNRRTSLQVTDGGNHIQPLISYGYDNDNELTTVTPAGGQPNTFCYDPLGRLCQQILANGVTTTWSFDAAGFLTSLLTQKGATTLDSHSWSRDAVGNPLTETNNSFNASFSFDDLYRITGATDPTGTYTWGYDADNNRLSQLLNGTNTSYTVDTANHLTSVGGVPVSVDANGNLTDDGQGNTYTWDVRGRLVKIYHNGVQTASFTYNTDGIRTSETINGVTTHFTIDHALCVLDNNATDSSPTTTMFGPAGPFCRGVQYYTPDAAGSIATVTDTSGNHIQHNQYGVFGQQVTDSLNSGNPLGFLGGMSDPNGLMNVGGSVEWSSSLGQSIGNAIDGFGRGVGHCLIGAAVGLAHQISVAASPFGSVVEGVQAAAGFVQSVQDKGLAQAVLDPIADTLQQFGDFSSPEAIGNSLCNDTLLALTIEGGVRLVKDPLPPEAAGGVCFPAGTRVTTKGGTKPIEQIRVGDTVLSADPATGKQSYQKVVRTFVHHSSVLLTIVTADGRRITATPTHPFWVKGKGFVAAKRLAGSDLLKDDHGRYVAISRITRRYGKFTVYNFEVAHTHTYYAGGWWVHNTCPPPPPSIGDVNFSEAQIENHILPEHGFQNAAPGDGEFSAAYSETHVLGQLIEDALSMAPPNDTWTWNTRNSSYNFSVTFNQVIGQAGNGTTSSTLGLAVGADGFGITAFPL